MVYLLCVEQRLVEALVPPLSAMLQPLSQPLLTPINALLTECLHRRGEEWKERGGEGRGGEGRGGEGESKMREYLAN